MPAFEEYDRVGVVVPLKPATLITHLIEFVDELLTTTGKLRRRSLRDRTGESE